MAAVNYSPTCVMFYGEKAVNWNHSLKAADVSGQVMLNLSNFKTKKKRL